MEWHIFNGMFSCQRAKGQFKDSDPAVFTAFLSKIMEGNGYVDKVNDPDGQMIKFFDEMATGLAMESLFKTNTDEKALSVRI